MTEEALQDFDLNNFISQSVMEIFKHLINEDLSGFVQSVCSSIDQLLQAVRNPECNLEKIYAQHQNRILLIKVDTCIPVYEIICRFADKQKITQPILIDANQHLQEHFW